MKDVVAQQYCSFLCSSIKINFSLIFESKIRSALAEMISDQVLALDSEYFSEVLLLDPSPEFNIIDQVVLTYLKIQLGWKVKDLPDLDLI